jgi:NAD(P)-dependent dehydrogenase (short-subunit alcohol dehydrogenase family)
VRTEERELQQQPRNGGELDGLVALVTGAGAGIGKAIAKRLASEGARVGALDVQPVRAEATVAEITAAGGAGLPLTANVAEPDQMKTAIDSLGNTFGHVDLVAANAGINGVWAPIDEIEPEEWAKTLDVNLKGTFLTFRYAVPWLKRQGGAAVVTASVHGTRIWSAEGATAYACAKAGQQTFARKMAVELGRDRIRVNTICPGYIDTQIGESTIRRDLEKIKLPVTFQGRPIPATQGASHQPEDVAELALFLLSGRASVISGTEVWIDGATSLVVG